MEERVSKWKVKSKKYPPKADQPSAEKVKNYKLAMGS